MYRQRHHISEDQVRRGPVIIRVTTVWHIFKLLAISNLMEVYPRLGRAVGDHEADQKFSCRPSDMEEDVARECIWAIGEFGAASAPAPYAFEALVERMPTVSSPDTRYASHSSLCGSCLLELGIILDHERHTFTPNTPSSRSCMPSFLGERFW